MAIPAWTSRRTWRFPSDDLNTEVIYPDVNPRGTSPANPPDRGRDSLPAPRQGPASNGTPPGQLPQPVPALPSGAGHPVLNPASLRPLRDIPVVPCRMGKLPAEPGRLKPQRRTPSSGRPLRRLRRPRNLCTDLPRRIHGTTRDDDPTSHPAVTGVRPAAQPRHAGGDRLYARWTFTRCVFPGRTKKDEFKPPERIVTFWSDTVLHQPEKPAIRGFGGRVFFYGEDESDADRSRWFTGRLCL